MIHIPMEYSRMKLIISQRFGKRQLLLVNSKGRETEVTLDAALTLWRAGIAQPDDETSRCIIRGWY